MAQGYLKCMPPHIGGPVVRTYVRTLLKGKRAVPPTTVHMLNYPFQHLT